MRPRFVILHFTSRPLNYFGYFQFGLFVAYERSALVKPSLQLRLLTGYVEYGPQFPQHRKSTWRKWSRKHIFNQRLPVNNHERTGRIIHWFAYWTEYKMFKLRKRNLFFFFQIFSSAKPCKYVVCLLTQKSRVINRRVQLHFCLSHVDRFFLADGQKRVHHAESAARMMEGPYHCFGQQKEHNVVSLDPCTYLATFTDDSLVPL